MAAAAMAVDSGEGSPMDEGTDAGFPHVKKTNKIRKVGDRNAFIFQAVFYHRMRKNIEGFRYIHYFEYISTINFTVP
jgi:hypothetical protein